MAMTGQTFSPANSQASGGPSGSAPTLQDAIRLLSFRLPTNVGASAPAAPALLAGGPQTLAGMPQGTESWLQTLFGGGAGGQLPPFLQALQERLRTQGGMPGAPGGQPGMPGAPGGGGQAPPPVFQFPYPGQGPGVPLDPNQGGGSFPGPQTQPYRPVPQQPGGGQNYPGGSPSFTERGPMLGQPGPFSERGPFLG